MRIIQAAFAFAVFYASTSVNAQFGLSTVDPTEVDDPITTSLTTSTTLQETTTAVSTDTPTSTTVSLFPVTRNTLSNSPPIPTTLPPNTSQADQLAAALTETFKTSYPTCDPAFLTQATSIFFSELFSIEDCAFTGNVLSSAPPACACPPYVKLEKAFRLRCEKAADDVKKSGSGCQFAASSGGVKGWPNAAAGVAAMAAAAAFAL